jgi:hypothetical protein
VTFDAQCDLAAVVDGPDDDPDRLFIDVADDLSRSGRRPVGPHRPVGAPATPRRCNLLRNRQMSAQAGVSGG